MQMAMEPRGKKSAMAGRERALIIRTALGWQKKVKKHPNLKVDNPIDDPADRAGSRRYKGRVQTRGKGILHSLPTSEQSRWRKNRACCERFHSVSKTHRKQRSHRAFKAEKLNRNRRLRNVHVIKKPSQNSHPGIPITKPMLPTNIHLPRTQVCVDSDPAGLAFSTTTELFLPA